jgi:hypothetical protein
MICKQLTRPDDIARVHVRVHSLVSFAVLTFDMGAKMKEDIK